MYTKQNGGTESQCYCNILDFCLGSRRTGSHMHQYLKIHYAVASKVSTAQTQSSINQYSTAKTQNSFWGVVQQQLLRYLALHLPSKLRNATELHQFCSSNTTHKILACKVPFSSTERDSCSRSCISMFAEDRH